MWENPRFWENKEGEKAEFIYSLYLYFSYDIPILIKKIIWEKGRIRGIKEELHRIS